MSAAPPVHGLSRDVTLAVLPRLYIEELVAELTRRNISFGGYSIKQEFLVGVLEDAMIQEYRNLEPEECPSDGDAVDSNVDFTPDAEPVKFEQVQHHVLKHCSQTSARIYQSHKIENRRSPETATQCHDENDTVTNKESSFKDKAMCSDADLDASSSWSRDMISTSATAIAGRTATEYGPESNESETFATALPIPLPDNVNLPKTDAEDAITHDDDESDFQGFGTEKKSSSGNTSSTCLEPQDTMLYTCKDCDYRTEHRSEFVTHTRIHTGEKLFTCPHCDYRATRRSNLKRHMLLHSGEKPFMCPYCDYRAVRREHLKSHMYHHSGEKPFQCSQCEFQTAEKRTLIEHMRKHTGEKPYMCGECGFQTAYKSSIDLHMKRHVGDKPHVCGACGFRTTQKARLAVHQRRHTGEKPFIATRHTDEEL